MRNAVSGYLLLLSVDNNFMGVYDMKKYAIMAAVAIVAVAVAKRVPVVQDYV